MYLESHNFKNGLQGASGAINLIHLFFNKISKPKGFMRYPRLHKQFEWSLNCNLDYLILGSILFSLCNTEIRGQRWMLQIFQKGQ